MGVQLRPLIPESAIHEIELKNLFNKALAIDAFNALYQFITTIRQPDGTPLKDRQGRITSHLSGLLYRTANLVEQGIKPVYVFDGKPPELKKKEIEERIKRKEEAAKEYEMALKMKNWEVAKTKAAMASKLTSEMVEDSKRLLSALGIPWVQAPSEGEAQAAYMAAKGDVYASASQDYDSLLFGTPRLVRNVTVTGKRKLPGKKVYVEVKPELIVLEEVLSALGITREQLVDIAILMGTDFNEGVAGVGPKRAYELVKKLGSADKALKVLNAKIEELEEVRRIFLSPPVTDEYKLEWKEPDREKVIEILVEEHDFSRERVENALKRYETIKKVTSQSTLEAWFS